MDMPTVPSLGVTGFPTVPSLGVTGLPTPPSFVTYTPLASSIFPSTITPPHTTSTIFPTSTRITSTTSASPSPAPGALAPLDCPTCHCLLSVIALNPDVATVKRYHGNCAYICPLSAGYDATVLDGPAPEGRMSMPEVNGNMIWMECTEDDQVVYASTLKEGETREEVREKAKEEAGDGDSGAGRVGVGLMGWIAVVLALGIVGI